MHELNRIRRPRLGPDARAAWTLLRALVLILANASLLPAQTADLEPFADVALVSDYRFRGVSLSAEDPAIQGGVGLAHRSGVVIGAWGSSIEQFGGAETEIDLYASWGRPIAGVRVDAGATAYLYPGADAVEYGELWATAGGAVASLGWAFGVALAPAQNNLADQANRYAFGSLSTGSWISPFSIDATLGVENGAFGPGAGGSRVNWDVGASATLGGLAARAAYVDTSEMGTASDATVVFSVGMAL